MAEFCESSSHIDYRIHKTRLARLADRQAGRVAWYQLLSIGIGRKTVYRWVQQGYLHRVLPRVYAVGHAAPSVEGDLTAALLYAGPGAALSHTTAAWWWGLLDRHPQVIHVSTPRQCRSIENIKVHGRRHAEGAIHRDVPTTSLPQIFLDLAATTSRRTLRTALASADYRGLLDLDRIEAVLASSPHGGANLRAAIQRHLPDLARTKSQLEVLLLELCEKHRIPLPEVNVQVNGWEVDALWREARLAVELDGGGNHQTPAQRRRDRRKDMAMRAAGFTPIRYSDEQLTREQRQVAAELRSAVAAA